MKSEKTDNQVELGSKVVGEIELPQIDVSKFIGRKVPIENVTEHEGSFGYYIRIATQVVETLDVKDPQTGNPVELRGTRIFGLQTDAQDNIGWGVKTKLGQFLKKMNVVHYRDLVGKEVVIQSVTNSEDGKDYLTFN